MARKSMELPEVSKLELLDAIREGVAEGIWRVATNATEMPTHDFFDFVQAGVRQAMEKLNRA